MKPGRRNDVVSEVSQIQGILKPVFPKNRVRKKILFGSYSIGQETPRSHVDIMVDNLADMAAMNEIIDSRAFSALCLVDSSNQIPNGDTIGRFRNILIQHIQIPYMVRISTFPNV